MFLVYLSTVLDADGAVVHLYQEDALWVWAEQQRERRVSADMSGEEQWTRAGQLIQVTVKCHYKLICHQQSLVFWKGDRDKDSEGHSLGISKSSLSILTS